MSTLARRLREQPRFADELTERTLDLLANMSHEIRTPMNAILGLTHLLGRDLADPVQQARLVKIDSAANHLLVIINDILDRRRYVRNRTA